MEIVNVLILELFKNLTRHKLKLVTNVHFSFTI